MVVFGGSGAGFLVVVGSGKGLWCFPVDVVSPPPVVSSGAAENGFSDDVEDAGASEGGVSGAGGMLFIEHAAPPEEVAVPVTVPLLWPL